MVEKKASDLFFTSNAPIKIKIEGQIFPVNKQVLSPERCGRRSLASCPPEQREWLPEEWENSISRSPSPGSAASA